MAINVGSCMSEEVRRVARNESLEKRLLAVMHHELRVCAYFVHIYVEHHCSLQRSRQRACCGRMSRDWRRLTAHF